MAILIIADEFPWPSVNGSRLRLAHVIDALTEMADVDLLIVGDRHPGDDHAAPAAHGVARAASIERAPLRRSIGSIVRWLTSGLPRELAWREWAGARQLLAGWRRPEYDLVWFAAIESFLALGDLLSGPRVVDYDDLESSKIAHRRAAAPAVTPGLAGRARRWAARSADGLDHRRWFTIEHRVAGQVDRVLVCSELDRQRLGEPNAAVVPNGYDPVAGLRRERAPGATLLFVGLLIYPPNVDAAELLARQVLPRVRTVLPDAVLRLVGQPTPAVEALAGLPGVMVTGQVPDVAPELARADVVVVPLRVGGGTRLKILEAFAHQVPVVTTTVGCEGLEVVHDRHLLIADTMDRFADEVIRVLRDDKLRARLVDAASELFESTYRWDGIRPQIQSLAKDVIGAPRAPRSR